MPSSSKHDKPYKQIYSLSERKQRSSKLNQYQPGMVPLIVERSRHSSLPNFPYRRFVCHCNSSFAALRNMIARRLHEHLQSSQGKDSSISFNMSINSQIPPLDSTMIDLYNKMKDQDGFLYVQYQEMGTF